jgi:hypothetical protein
MSIDTTAQESGTYGLDRILIQQVPNTHTMEQFISRTSCPLLIAIRVCRTCHTYMRRLLHPTSCRSIISNNRSNSSTSLLRPLLCCRPHDTITSTIAASLASVSTPLTGPHKTATTSSIVAAFGQMERQFDRYVGTHQLNQ